MRVCAVQWQMRTLECFEDFAQQVEFYVDVAADYGSDFITFPELFTLELLSLVEAHGPGEAARMLAEYTPRYLDLMTDLRLVRRLQPWASNAGKRLVRSPKIFVLWSKPSWGKKILSICNLTAPTTIVAVAVAAF